MNPVVKHRGTLIFKGGHSTASTQVKPGNLKSRPVVEPSHTPKFISGDGRIVCSGVTVQGMESKFKEQLKPGDMITIFHPQTLLEESRMVINVLSQRSLVIQTPFSSDFVTTVEYRIVRARTEDSSELEETLKKEEQLSSGEHVRKLDDSSIQPDQVLTYREKVGMSYRTVSMKVDPNMSKEELLDLQTKKSHDRYC